MEYITTVDENGNVLGTEEKVKCHLGEGILHSAFLIILFNDKDEVILAKRSRAKMLWPDFWDGTVASHYDLETPREDRVKQRVFFETGVDCPQIEYLFQFRYQAKYEDVGSENELCDVFAARGIRCVSLDLNESEISEYTCLGTSELAEKIAADSMKITPWFVIALRRYLEIEKESDPRHKP